MTESGLQKIAQLEKELWQQQNFDDDWIYNDLTGLFVDIIGEISSTDTEKALNIYDYAKLLQQEIFLYSSATAYQLGCDTAGLPEDAVLKAYLKGISQKKARSGLDDCIRNCYDEICALLGKHDDLLTDFTEIYNKVHGLVKNNIHLFIRLGQESGENEPIKIT